MEPENHEPIGVRRLGASRQALDAALVNVEGWLGSYEAWALHEAVRTHPTTRPLVAIEIGSWKGRSGVAIGRGLESRGAGHLFAVDPHGSTVTHEQFQVTDTYEEFTANIRAAGLQDHVSCIRATSVTARARFDAGTVHFLFVDGSHDYEDVIQDISAWTSALAPGATVAFQDFAWPGVRRALRERVIRRDSPFRKPRLVENTLFFDYAPVAVWTAGDTLAQARLRLYLARLRGYRRMFEILSPTRQYLPRSLARLAGRLRATLSRGSFS